MLYHPTGVRIPLTMSERGLLSLSLAAKCRLLFGLAVVLIIGSALFVPWYSFEALVHARNLQRTSSLALLARAMLDPTNTDWAQQQARLDQWWADNADLLRRPKGKPLFVQLATPEPAGMAADRLRDTLD